MPNHWTAELWRIAVITLVGALLGWPFGHPALVVAAGYLALLSWHLSQLFRLESWLRQRRKFNPPESWGIWDDVFHHIYRTQQRNRNRKKRLAAILTQYQKATHAMPDATVVLGPNGEIQWFNEAARHLLDLHPSKDNGQRIDNLIRFPAFVTFLAKGAVGNLDMPSPRDHRVTLNVRVVPYGDEQRLLIAKDVSERQRLEQMRRDFIGNVSHELRTPLTVVRGFLETLADSDDECAHRWGPSLELMRQQSVRMQHLIDDLLLLSRLETDPQSPSREVVAVSAMTAMIREDAKLLSGDKNHRFVVECQPDLNLLGAERELYSAFNNLVTNAIRYTPAGGTITVRWYEDGEGAHFKVSDTGVGIPAEHLPRITERFYRVDGGRARSDGGTGLGLAIVKHVLNRHDARLLIESEPGRGSSFRCDFPSTRIAPRQQRA